MSLTTIGIIAEGPADQFVLRNILYAFGLEKNQIQFVRPELNEDETDKTNSNEKRFGSWTNVKKECESATPFDDFLNNQLAGDKLIIIHLDSDVCNQYGVQKTSNPRTAQDFTDFRQKIMDKINEWLDNKYVNQLFYAICIKQMDAWVLTLLDNKGNKDTGSITNPKDILEDTKAYKKVKKETQKTRIIYGELSDNFSYKKKLKEAIKYNQSLKDFVNSLESYFEAL